MTVPLVLGNRDELDAALRLHRRAGRPVALVPTMGALHEGHARLLDVAAELAPVTVVSVFVNPLQFGPGEDFERYPRSLDADVARCAERGVEVVFAPTAGQMYPGGAPQVTVDPGPLGAELEGAVRPGHFTGVLTVVAKLLNLVAPDVAVFGEKDYQQLVLVRRMVADLSLGVDVVGVPTVRETDGLALSSRNRYLSPAERTAAAQLSAALHAGAAAARDGASAQVGAVARDGAAAAAEEAARRALADVPALVPDYVAARSPELGPAPDAGEGRLLVAVRAGGTRLIDNTALSFGIPPLGERP